MTTLSPVAVLFRKWTLAEMAMRYAQPCPDEVMDNLNEMVSDIERQLAAAPAQSAEDVLYKLFPLVLANFESAAFAHPMVPAMSGGSNGLPVLLDSVVGELRDYAPGIAEAMALPNPFVDREAA